MIPYANNTSTTRSSLPWWVHLSTFALFCLLVFARSRRVRRLESANFRRLDQNFEICPDVRWDSYRISSTLMSIGGGTDASRDEKPFARGFLFLGGFGDVPALWQAVIDDMARIESADKFFCLCPRTPGWGRTNFAEAHSLRWQDWAVAARDALMVCKTLCNHVTLVGHSTGALVAANICEHYEVDCLVFTGPNFFSNPSDRWAKDLLLGPFGGVVDILTGGLVSKKLRGKRPVDNNNQEIYETGWYLSALPINMIRQMWKLQQLLQNSARTGSAKLRVKESVLVIMGEEDQSVGPLSEQLEVVSGLVSSNDILIRSEIIPGAAHGLPCEKPRVVSQLSQLIFNA